MLMYLVLQKSLKTSHELWNSIWGKRILSVRQEIAEIGVDHSTREQSEFRLDFRVPFSLFEDIVKDCIEAHIFTTGKKAPLSLMNLRYLHV